MAVEPFLRTRPQQGFIGTSQWFYNLLCKFYADLTSCSHLTLAQYVYPVLFSQPDL
jgi:hypothetical protein